MSQNQLQTVSDWPSRRECFYHQPRLQQITIIIIVSLSLRPPHPPLGAMYHPTQSTNVEIHNLTGEKYHTHYSNLFFLMVVFP